MSAINGVFYLLSLCFCYSSPRRVTRRIGKFCMGCGRAELAIDKGSVADSRLTSTLVQLVRKQANIAG